MCNLYSQLHPRCRDRIRDRSVELSDRRIDMKSASEHWVLGHVMRNILLGGIDMYPTEVRFNNSMCAIVPAAHTVF